MRLVFVGDFSGESDEGMRIISRKLSYRFAEKHEMILLNPRETPTIHSIRQVINFRPQIFHYLTGPTLRSLIILRIYKFLFPFAKTISSATRPFFPTWQYGLIKWLKPDLFLTQNPQWEEIFKSKGAVVSFLPNGVDTDRFRTVNPPQKIQYRQKFGFPTRERIILHVGHLRKNRNLQLLIDLQSNNVGQVVVVAGTAMQQDGQLKQMLESSGCIVVDTYQSDIQQIYAAADVYVFPVLLPPDGRLPEKYNQVGVIDLPLSVLEAMASNLPVISTPFPALKRVFEGTGGLFWFDGTAQNACQIIESIEPELTDTRRQVLGLDWSLISQQLELVYQRIINLASE